jgi:hypothetical protein
VLKPPYWTTLIDLIGNKRMQFLRNAVCAAIFCLWLANHSALPQLETDEIAIDRLVQEFNQALTLHSDSQLRKLLSKNVEPPNLDCNATTMTAALKGLVGEPEVMSEQSPPSIRRSCTRFIRNDVAFLDLRRVSFSSGAGATTTSYAVVATKQQGRWSIAVVRLVGTAMGAPI